VGRAQLNPNSRHHLAFNLGFPNAFDRQLGRTGSALMVHGGCSSIGCYAITDESVDEVYAVVEAALATGRTRLTCTSSRSCLPRLRSPPKGPAHGSRSGAI
jgi:murein L,D-transpeptidase YafK